ncbi:efflux RND transporter periplasmic adaptor subunit [Roseixanthobacter liquoris]|uniref:efflux RND transporter periplasmic adaptor subunit n=1 Tax=Roseixanthobacter liquoris TaxID=3119921 RepID=UPI0037290E1F
MKRPILSLQLAAVSLLALMVAACEPTTVAAPAPPTVSASMPMQREVTGWDTFTGRLEAVDTIEVRPRVGGYVEKVAFRDGDYVRRGDLLFVIDPRPYQAAVTQAEGQLAQAHAQLDLAGKELERATSLVKTQAISTATVDQRQQAQDEAKAAVMTATGALDRAKLDLEFTGIHAPIDGRISRKLVGAGNLVAGGDAGATLLTTIVSLDTIDAYFDIDEQSYLRYRRLAEKDGSTSMVELGGQVQVALPGESTARFTGTLNFAENRLDASTGTLRLRARIANPGHALNPGQFVRISMVADAPHPALLVPASAVTSDSAQQVLYVVGTDDSIVARPVTLGRVFGKMREVTGGLEAGDRVVVSGLQRAQPGAKVNVKVETLDPKQFALNGGVL